MNRHGAGLVAAMPNTRKQQRRTEASHAARHSRGPRGADAARTASAALAAPADAGASSQRQHSPSRSSTRSATPWMSHLPPYVRDAALDAVAALVAHGGRIEANPASLSHPLCPGSWPLYPPSIAELRRDRVYGDCQCFPRTIACLAGVPHRDAEHLLAGT